MDDDLDLNEMYDFYSNLDEITDDASLDEEVIEDEEDNQVSNTSASDAMKGLKKYSLRLLPKTDREYFLARFFPEDLPTVQSSVSHGFVENCQLNLRQLLRIYREGEDTVEARREEIMEENKFLKKQQTFLASRRAKRQASEGIVKLPPRCRKRWCFECSPKQRSSAAQTSEESNVKKLFGSLEGESSATYALFILDDERNEADFIPLDKYCRYHFRYLPTTERSSELDAEEAERKIQRQNRVEQKEWERLPTKEDVPVPKVEAISVGADTGNLFSARANAMETFPSSYLQNDKVSKGRKGAKISKDTEDVDYEEKFEDDDVSLGEEMEQVEEQEEEKGLSDEDSQVFQREHSKDLSSNSATKSSPYRKRSRLEETASVGSASPSAFSSSDSDSEDIPNLSHSGREIRRLLWKEKTGSDSGMEHYLL